MLRSFGSALSTKRSQQKNERTQEERQYTFSVIVMTKNFYTLYIDASISELNIDPRPT